MSNVDELFNKINKMSISELMILCSNMIDSEVDKKIIDGVLHILEVRLQTKRVSKSLGLKDD